VKAAKRSVKSSMQEQWWGIGLEGTWLRKISEGSHTSPSSKFGVNSAIQAFGGLKIHPNKRKRKQKKGSFLGSNLLCEREPEREGKFKGSETLRQPGVFSRRA
jgi:hypothetical protein